MLLSIYRSHDSLDAQVREERRIRSSSIAAAAVVVQVILYPGDISIYLSISTPAGLSPPHVASRMARVFSPSLVQFNLPGNGAWTKQANWLLTIYSAFSKWLASTSWQPNCMLMAQSWSSKFELERSSWKTLMSQVDTQHNLPACKSVYLWVCVFICQFSVPD